jgi:hypothetical protein
MRSAPPAGMQLWAIPFAPWIFNGLSLVAFAIEFLSLLKGFSFTLFIFSAAVSLICSLIALRAALMTREAVAQAIAAILVVGAILGLFNVLSMIVTGPI